ncbi:hypothetical protein HELRODRAFT_173395 [Helobdella robusta]|uniref:RRM domain-containing protein n=1 Tax=Helobdella robusta TaxID=6412 RepID=T1F6S0_HELRO|nr:hypothetical protein HELRODRAFT_173395 [Helobdella robusta]ESO03696.1 hypothetical protein HELRODRAFT_173395 [Helobdella robusta]
MAEQPVTEGNEQPQTGYRMWIGNLHPQITEYTFLKLLQSHQINLKKLDFVYHRSGPLKGKSMGFCFLTVPSISDADKLIKHLDGKRLFQQNLVIKPADADAAALRKSQSKKKFQRKGTYALAGYSQSASSSSNSIDTSQMSEAKRRAMIREIEKKLKAMDDDKNDTSVFTKNS